MQNCRSANVAGRVVLMRVDFNVPMQNGIITDSTRIESSLQGIDYLREQGAKLILLSHFGRPNGKIMPDLSLRPIAQKLSDLLNMKVAFIESVENLASFAKNMQAGEVALLENLRFYPGEEANDKAFVKQLASAGDIYINDAFSAAHRAHASTEGLAHELPSFSGFLLEREVAALSNALQNPNRPMAAIVGGAKISSKIEILENLTAKADILIIAGAMANVFLAADGIAIGKSLCESEAIHFVGKIRAQAEKNNTQLILPRDGVCATGIGQPQTARKLKNFNAISDNEMILDMGDASLDYIINLLDSAKTIIMNGPLGVFEVVEFSHGTNRLCEYLAMRAGKGCLVIAGGGDTVSAVKKSGFADNFSHLSTAGGAFLEWLEGKNLPGIAALK